MSKNVAVFVDVANIFYAAKAAGVDIDYVTLLKSATAGRDFVRAYAYTGLDPDNENQRQFHAFLARSGYKVISKDIRKYGDGRIKANLDIELVVDMMRMAEHLDIAVVVSGDGDFAPAIRAVQQMGVRVEVISFRGNTSSDLIEVADVFTDIGQVARVEKGARSGRRVASEGDLSMTEVPEKETEGPVRRRRGSRPIADRQVAVEAPAEALPGNVIVLPGERLSRVEPDEVRATQPIAEMASGDPEPGTIPDGPEAQGDEDGEARRRRRRRGGRGRGRGRRPEGAEVSIAAPITEVGAEGIAADDEYPDESPVALPQHSTFGSVWDSQLGVPTVPSVSAVTDLSVDEEDYEDEPEIPDYLTAERRRQASRQRGGRGRDRGGAYRAALDRERYGRGGAPSSFGGGGMRPPDRSRGARDNRMPAPAPTRGRPPFREQQGFRDLRQPQPSQPSSVAPPPRPQSSAEPWSEVPPEVAELLKAELARRSSRQNGAESAPAAEITPERATPTETMPAIEEATAKPPARRPRVRKSPAAETTPVEPVVEPMSGEAPAPPAKPRAARRTSVKADKAAGTAAAPATQPVAAPAQAEPAVAAKPRRRTSTRKPSAAPKGAAADTGSSDAASPADG